LRSAAVSARDAGIGDRRQNAVFHIAEFRCIGIGGKDDLVCHHIGRIAVGKAKARGKAIRFLRVLYDSGIVAQRDVFGQSPRQAADQQEWVNEDGTGSENGACVVVGSHDIRAALPIQNLVAFANFVERFAELSHHACAALPDSALKLSDRRPVAGDA